MEDSSILALFFARDPEAIEESQRKYAAYCRSIAYGILHSREDAEECLNDLWLRAWNSIPPERPKKLALYLGRIVRNLALDRLDYRRASKRTAPAGLAEELRQCLPDCRDNIAGLELTDLLNRFLRSLPEEPRNIFLRRYWFADSIEQIARRFGMTKGGVRASLCRTRKKLRAYLEEAGIHVG